MFRQLLHNGYLYRKVTPQMRHGKLLVQMGALSPKDLWWGVKNQVLEIIYSLFSWEQGSFAFYESDEQLRGDARRERLRLKRRRDQKRTPGRRSCG